MVALVERYKEASDETRRLVDRLLEQDADDHAWKAQLGPVFRQGDVARLLGKTKQAVSEDRKLLRLEMRSGAVGYPVFQFDGRRLLPGIDEVVAVLGPAVETPWTIASWLTSPQPALDGATPLTELRADRTERVVDLATQTAASAAR